MKRSRSLSLFLMGSLALGASGCGTDRVQEEGLYTFTSLKECTDSSLFSEAECLNLAQNAANNTPRFDSREECEARFGSGACQTAPRQTSASPPPSANGTVVTQGSHNLWTPMLMGFMAGRFLGSGGMMHNSQALYRDTMSSPQQGGSSFRTAAGDSVRADATGRVVNPSSRIVQSIKHNAKPTMTRGASTTRGGFSGGSGYGGGAS